MTLKIDDPFIMRWIKPGVVVFLVLLMLPGVAAIYIAVTVVLPGNAETTLALTIESLIHAGGVPVDIAKLILSSIPAVLAAVAFRPGSTGTLTRVGRVAFVVLVLGGVAALLGTYLLNPESVTQAGRLTEGRTGIEHLRGGAEASVRYAVTYMALLLGLQVEVKQ